MPHAHTHTSPSLSSSAGSDADSGANSGADSGTPEGGEGDALVTVGSLQRSLKARMDSQRTPAARVADKLTYISGSMTFLIVNFVWFFVWMVVNLGVIPGVPVFDPFPFGLLTMIVSLEAIGLAIVVLISQNRAAAIAELREEMTLTIGEITERELTKLMALTTRILEEQGVDLSEDEELHDMLQNTDTEEIIEELKEDIGGDLAAQKSASVVAEPDDKEAL